jgi:hypothetical protein
MSEGATSAVGTGEILRQTWRMFRAHLWTFVSLMGFPIAAMILCTLVMYFWLVPIRPGVSLRDVWAGMGFARKLGVFLLLLVNVAVINRVLVASIFAVREFHDDREIGALRSFRNVRRKHLRLLWLLFVVGIFGGGPLAVVALPAAVFSAVFFAPAFPVAALESLGVWGALRRSIALTRGGYCRILLLFLLYLVLVVAGVFAFFGALASAEQSLGSAWFWRPMNVLAFWIILLIPQWYMIALTLNYFDQRRRRGELTTDSQ